MMIQRCTKCIIPVSAKISFDKHQCCELCKNVLKEKKTKKTGSESVKGISDYIELIRKEGKYKKFDCLVGISGGRDSSFLLYSLVKKHNLRCMAAYHRTPFTPDAIDSNVRKLCKDLSVPLVEMNISSENHIAFTRKMILLWEKNPDNIIANLACAPCKKHNQEVYRIAKKNDIRYIVFGGNKYEHFPLGSASSKRTRFDDSKKISLWHDIKQFFLVCFNGIPFLIKHIDLIKFLPEIFRASVLHISNRTLYLRARYPFIKMLDYYFIAGYHEQEVNNFIREWGWKKPENCSSSWRADCSFTELKNFFFNRKSGMTYMDAYLSNMVREGVISRDEALIRTESEANISFERINEVFTVLNLNSENYRNIIIKNQSCIYP